MPTVIPVKFTFAPRDLWFDPADTGATVGDHVVCSTERGLELGLATSSPREVSDTEYRDTCGDAPLKPVVRVATEEDLDHADLLAEKGAEALPVFRNLVKESGLEMKPVGVEYLFGGERVVCYFAAEERVDFRQLVRDLSRALHERIDMRQIGVREEAALMGGFAHCGQELCCARYGNGFEPVSIRMAKEQDLPLNSPKISGACGRLMCCLRYEFDAYKDFKGRAPKKNAVIKTPLGTARIMEYDTPREALHLRLENGKQIKVALADMECSEAACKKSEELGCACRPDTVGREVLDRIESPEIQSALAELDRESGVLPPEDYADEDIVFVSEGRRRRRRAQLDEQAAEKAAKGGKDQPKGRRKSKGDQASKEGGDSRRSRRRRHRAPEGTQKPQGQETSESTAKEGAAPKPRRRPGDKGGAVQEGEAPKGEGRPNRRRRRRKGNGGQGEGTRAQGQNQNPKGPKGEGAPKGQPKKDQGPKDGGAKEGGEPKRRRRRRGGRGRGRGQGGSDGASNGNPQA